MGVSVCLVCDYNMKYQNDIRWVSQNSNTLLRCKVSKDRQHVSALLYKVIIRSDMVNFSSLVHHVRPDDGLIEKGRNVSIF